MRKMYKILIAAAFERQKEKPEGVARNNIYEIYVMHITTTTRTPIDFEIQGDIL